MQKITKNSQKIRIIATSTIKKTEKLIGQEQTGGLQAEKILIISATK